ncbi:MAG: hypothetical protein LQ351_000579 [Letrouitia transgressa]|nr:MAG: hypothetical protein LQ351_000579 [Letrouitia transgressa]
MSSKRQKPPTQVEQQARKLVGINAETVTDITSTDFPGHHPGENHEWSLDLFRKNFRVVIHQNDPLNASFSLVGIDASIANAFRRILIAEIPTLAIETVYYYNNTSIVQDEVLAQRLGLIPLTGNRDGLRWLHRFHKPTDDNPDGTPIQDNTTVVLELDIECDFADDYDEKIIEGEDDPKVLYKNAHVYAKDLKYNLTGRQSEYFLGEENTIRPVNPDILLTKMRPGQAIKLEAHCVKSIGADHAKYSPVAPATYRLLPKIDIIKPILGQDAKKFAGCFRKGVIGLQKVTEEEASIENSGYEGHAGEKKAVVKNAFTDTVSRECLRHPEFEGKVKLGRVRDHFIFSVESTGQFESDELFLESVKILKEKCATLRQDLANVLR